MEDYTDEDALPSSEEEPCEFFDYDGDVTITEYSDVDQDVEQHQQKYTFPKPMNYQLFESTDDIDKMFNNKVQVYHIPQRWVQRSNEPKVVNTKLCRLYLLNKACAYNNLCKFSHHFSTITRCKYDYCKKTKLVGPGVFINTSSNMCRLRHHTETLNSFIYRTRQVTTFDIHIDVYKEFLEEFKKNFVFPMKCKQLWLRIIINV